MSIQAVIFLVRLLKLPFFSHQRVEHQHNMIGIGVFSTCEPSSISRNHLGLSRSAHIAVAVPDGVAGSVGLWIIGKVCSSSVPRSIQINTPLVHYISHQVVIHDDRYYRATAWRCIQLELRTLCSIETVRYDNCTI